MKIIGSRNLTGDHVPGISLFGRKFSNFWVAYQTGLSVRDSQSGFRLYPLFAIQNYSIITRLHDVSQGLRSVVMLAPDEAKLWLDAGSSEKDLEVVVGSRTQASRHQARDGSLSRRSAQMVAPGLLV